jgi:hypothetical protein
MMNVRRLFFILLEINFGGTQPSISTNTTAAHRLQLKAITAGKTILQGSSHGKGTRGMYGLVNVLYISR